MTTIFNVRPRALNVGNDVIARGLKQFLAEAFQEEVNLISIPATSKYESHNKAGLNAGTIYQVNQYGHGVIVGGGNLYENGELEFDMNAIDQLEPPLMLFSLSMGRVYGRNGKLTPRTDRMPLDRIRKLNARALVSHGRCQATLDYMAENGIDNAVLGGCPTVFLNETRSSLPTVAAANSGLTLVSIRNPALMNIPPSDKAKVKRDIDAIVALLRSQGHDRVKLLCHDIRDIEFAAAFEGVEYIFNEDSLTFLAILAEARLLVSYRLHATLPRLSYGLPCVNISYDERAKSLMETVGFGEWDIDMIQCDDVVKEVTSRLDDFGRLWKLRDEAASTHAHLREVASRGFAQFARAVREFQAAT
ncbi:MAG: polysaccharide pyruvyl transferase family protein [Hoeflea sp.]|uniref:polysaccharide pyruvyl transferase family protein n=1 Tax=Hoeflea sp. TaxID=1940281 RepID=UPI003298E4E0